MLITEAIKTKTKAVSLLPPGSYSGMGAASEVGMIFFTELTGELGLCSAPILSFYLGLMHAGFRLVGLWSGIVT